MKLKLIGDSILAYMPKGKLDGEEERHAIENAELDYLENYILNIKIHLLILIFFVWALMIF